MPTPVLDGQRVSLRPVNEGDLDFCHTFANDPDLRALLRFEQPITWEEERAWLMSIDPDEGGPVWLMETRDDARAVGLFSLTDWAHVARQAELGLGILAPEDRGRGFGHDAIRVALAWAFAPEGMNLQRVHLTVYDHNPARRLYERVGFRHEGTRRRHAYKAGAYRDLHMYGLLREEWSA